MQLLNNFSRDVKSCCPLFVFIEKTFWECFYLVKHLPFTGPRGEESSVMERDQEIHAKKFIESLMADFKLIHNEAKKKFPAVKEVDWTFTFINNITLFCYHTIILLYYHIIISIYL